MQDTLLARDLAPRSELVVPEHNVRRAKFSAIDAHNHLWTGTRPRRTERMRPPPRRQRRRREIDLDQIVREMDYLNIESMVNLSGGSGDNLASSLDQLDRAYPGRFITFCNADWTDVAEKGWAEKAAAQIEADVRTGARGFKVYKGLGLYYRDAERKLFMPDDPRLGALWDKTGELDVPVLIHVGDPVAFFRPLDRYNERWDELLTHDRRQVYGPEFPTFEELIESLGGLLEAHRGTDFIVAHVGAYAMNLGYVAQMLDEHPNLYVDISASIGEIGRAPYTARAWFIEHADRILFGTDSRPSLDLYQTYFRVLETADEYFDYEPAVEVPPQGWWRIYGLYLPDDVLQRVYRDNAVRLLRLG